MNNKENEEMNNETVESLMNVEDMRERADAAKWKADFMGAAADLIERSKAYLDQDNDSDMGEFTPADIRKIMELRSRLDDITSV